MHKRYLTYLQSTRRRQSNRSGFTVVEVMVVVAVIAVVLSLSTLSYTKIEKHSRDQKRNADITAFVAGLEKLYTTNGEYPPGCPESTCSYTALTSNTSTSALTSVSLLTTMQTILPNLRADFGDPLSPSKTQPLRNRTVDEKKYYYYGGTVNYTGSAYSLTFAQDTNFPCSIQSTLAAGTVGSYVVGYYSEETSKWVLTGGRHGTPMTITAGNTSDGCVINKG